MWLIDQLALLVARTGERPLIHSPIRRPTIDDFPDPWTGDLPALRRLCLRLMSYAEVLGPDVIFEPIGPTSSATPRPCAAPGPISGAEVSQIAGIEPDGRIRWRRREPLWFQDLHRGTLRFGYDPRVPLQGDIQLVGGVAREVARAWRQLHAVLQPDPGTEARLTDLTTVYLGLGLCTANSRGPADGLGPRQLGFLLAAQLLAREEGCWSTRKILGHLDPAPRDHARSALRQLRRPRGALRRRLGLDLLDDPPAIELG
ncbi:MAG TPA: hypothetical protein ENK18_15000 [Deltaproteobacteria bacterium]|nr:hypothetical protein [Deltaproteobacteria bacterium]